MHMNMQVNGCVDMCVLACTALLGCMNLVDKQCVKIYKQCDKVAQVKDVLFTCSLSYATWWVRGCSTLSHDGRKQKAHNISLIHQHFPQLFKKIIFSVSKPCSPQRTSGMDLEREIGFLWCLWIQVNMTSLYIRKSLQEYDWCILSKTNKQTTKITVTWHVENRWPCEYPSSCSLSLWCNTSVEQVRCIAQNMRKHRGSLKCAPFLLSLSLCIAS